MQLDIRTGIQTAIVLAIVGLVLLFWLGIRTIQHGQRLPFFRKRREHMLRGWRMIFLTIGLAVGVFFMGRFGEPVVYRFFPPSPTVTMTGTITLTPTISLTPTITETPTITNTPSVTNTPFMPEDVARQFSSTVTPNPESVFSPVVFAREIDDNLQPIEPSTEFTNPIGKLYGTFSYDRMTTGAQWSALWYRGTDLICLETQPWDGNTGGWGYTECELPAAAWLPGEYEVQIFVGMEWNNSGRFTVVGDAPTPVATASPTRTLGPTATITPIPPTRTPRPTITPLPTQTPRNTFTPTPTRTRTPTPTITLTPTRTRTPTITLTPTKTRTPRPTDTRWPTPTRIPPTPTR